ncbi:MAG TPA: trypsin-like peptidase domain-containing protein [Bacillota bacterium]|nr:trypsin-like peptidase domain-containing protein [Bacillota bacterium]
MLRRQFNTLPILIIAVLAMVFLPGCAPQTRPEGDQQRYQDHEFPGTGSQGYQIRAASEAGPIAAVAQQLSPSVVGISTRHVTRENIFTESEIIDGVGSGVIVHSDGYILTNEHVAGGVDEINVILQNGDELEGDVKWTDPTLDLAIVKVGVVGLPAANLGNSDQLSVGETVIAIGTPLGLQFQHTVTAGIISALDRLVKVQTQFGRNFMEDLIQTDASINPGNSGGPLINIDGEVIGINTVKVTSAEGIGFAIPIDVAKPVVDHFIAEGEFTTPYIGIVGFDRIMAKYYKQDGNFREGVYVMDIDPRGPAFRAGIRADDIIISIDDRQVSKMVNLRTAIYSKHVGARVKVTFLRDNQEQTTDMVLEEKEINR